MVQVIVKEVRSRKELRQFIYLPSRVHKNDSSWLPPIYADEWLLFNKKKNRSYQYTDAVFYVAYIDGIPVGRIMGLVNNRYNSIKSERNGRFCFLESVNNQDVVHALLTKAEGWVREKGMVKIVGPLGFSDKDPQGLQIEGFEYPGLFTAATNSPYLPGLLEAEGFSKEVDLVNYNIPMPGSLPEIYRKVYDKIAKSNEYKIIEFAAKKELKPYIIPVLELMNHTFSDIYGFVPLTNKEKREFAKRYLPILDPRFVKVVMKENEPAGFIIGLPDLTAGIIAAQGRLFPFGLYRILKEMKMSKKLMLMLGGVKKEFRGIGIDVLMGVKMLESAKKRNITVIDSHLILETNTRMRAECERLNGKIIKKFRIYQKVLRT